MKHLSIIVPTGLIGTLLIVCSINVKAQDQSKKQSAQQEAVTSAVNEHNYIFHAQTAIPTGGQTRQLTTDYTLKITHDQVIAELPYFGRAYTAPIDPTKGGIQFQSKDYQYNSIQEKNGSWNITIKPKDVPEIQQLMLTVFDNGNASLQVTNTNRQPISFTGYVTAGNVKEKP